MERVLWFSKSNTRASLEAKMHALQRQKPDVDASFSQVDEEYVITLSGPKDQVNAMIIGLQGALKVA